MFYFFFKRLLHPGQSIQQPSVPPPPVALAHIPILVPPQLAVVQATLPAIPLQQHVQQMAAQPAVQGQMLMAPQGAHAQQLVPGHATPLPTAIHGTQAVANLTIQQPANLVLQNALYQVMAQQGHSGTVTMDDVGNLLLTSGRASLHYRCTNASEDFQRQFNKR